MAAATTLLAASSAELTIRMVVGLVVVGLLLLALNRLTRRFLDGRVGNRPVIVIRHQQRLDKHASVTLLTAGERSLLVGTSGQSIVLLAEGDDLAARAGSAAEAWTGAVDRGTSPSPSSSSSPAPEPAVVGVGGEGGARVELRPGGWAHPIRVLQNKTVRRG